MALKDHYNYWDKFVSDWIQRTYNKPGIIYSNWNNPIKLELMNGINDPSYNYIPEPWWGYANKGKINAVVVNYNPGKGDPAQHHSNINKLLGNPPIPYSEFVLSEVNNARRILGKTYKFHWEKRAEKVFSSLNSRSEEYGLENFLSIELIPWHTPGVDSYVKTYIINNVLEVFKHSLLFAVEASRQIDNNHLHNVVLLRMNGAYTIDILNALIKNKVISGFEVLPVQGIENIKKVKYSDLKVLSYPELSKDGKNENYRIGFLPFSISHPDCNDITFLSVWGTKTHNDFPENQLLPWLFKEVLSLLKQEFA